MEPQEGRKEIPAIRTNRNKLGEDKATICDMAWGTATEKREIGTQAKTGVAKLNLSTQTTGNDFLKTSEETNKPRKRESSGKECRVTLGARPKTYKPSRDIEGTQRSNVNKEKAQAKQQHLAGRKEVGEGKETEKSQTKNQKSPQGHRERNPRTHRRGRNSGGEPGGVTCEREKKSEVG